MVMLKNWRESIKDRLESGEITMRQAREELCKSGIFPYVPSDEEALRALSDIVANYKTW